jgi:hypothetical protein
VITGVNLLLEENWFGVSRPLDLIADVRAALDNWPKFAKEAGLNEKAADAIAGSLSWSEAC